MQAPERASEMSDSAAEKRREEISVRMREW